MATPAERAVALREQIIARSDDAPQTPWEWQALDERARTSLETGVLPPRGSELFLHVEGGGVVHHRLAASSTAKILGNIQNAITSIGSTLSRDNEGNPSHGVRKATRFYVTPDIMPGSIVFHLDRDADSSPVPTGQDVLFESSDASAEPLADQSVAALIELVGIAEKDSAADLGVVTEKLRSLGPRTTSNLAKLAKELVKEDLSIDFGHMSTSGKRLRTTLGKRGCEVLAEAAERNKEQEDRVTLIGELNTISDGHDKVRITLSDNSEVLLTADKAKGAKLGPWITKRVQVEASRLTVWNLAKGKETLTFTLLEAQLAEEPSLPEE